MKNKTKVKLIAYLATLSMLLYGCKMSINNFFNKDKQDTPKKDFTTGAVSTETEETTLTTIPLTTETELSSNPTTETIESTSPEVPTEPTTIELPNEIIVKATTNVNIRSSNTADSIRIGELKINDIAYRILSCDNNWDLVKVDNLIGYICRDYLEYTDEIYESNYNHTPKTDIVITTTELNFRELPNSESKKITRFDKNTELEVIAEVDNGWLLVRNNGILGYVHGDYVVSLLELANLEYPDLNLEKLDVQKVVYTTASSLNIRTGNSTDYEIIGSLKKYESARVLGEYDEWYFIMTNEYKFGFISKNHTKDLDDIYVVVDLSEQRLYLYNDDELLYVTPVTTGKDETPSDIGLFKISEKVIDKTLTDNKTYWQPVKYWMRYNGGEGLHDADWRYTFDVPNVRERDRFGTELYHQYGSHGCINMPLQITDEIYETVSIGTKVLVHK